MNHSLRLLAALLLLELSAVCVCAQVTVPDHQTVTVWGETRVTDDPVADRQRAVGQARRNALERVVGTYVSSSSRTRNFQLVEDRIYTRSTGFINSYDILQEKRAQTHRVQIRAQVSLVPVAEELRASGLLRKWRIGVIMAPDRQQLAVMLNYYSQPRLMEVTRNIEATIGRQLVQAGFKLVDPRQLASLRKGFQTSQEITGQIESGIDLLVTGSVSLATRSSTAKLHQAICQVHGRILRVDTREVIYQGNIGNTFDGITLLVDYDVADKFADTLGNGQLADGTPDLRSFGQGAAAALDKAIHLAAAMSADIMVAQVTRLPAAVSSTIVLEIHGLDFNQLVTFEDHLKNMEGVAALTIEAFSDQLKTMEVEYDGDAMMLARELSKSDVAGELRLKVKGVTKNKITLKTQ